MQPPTSPRLPGVPLLGLDATGPEYSRWKRSVRFALAQKDTWKYCNGSCPMPMPKARSASPTREEINDAQPSLLDERRAWMRQDREVKLDIFLSLAEDVMEDLFDVGQPLPPTKYTAQQILEALDARFLVFDFQGYHHAFCHFLNLNIDQFASLEEFNVEFTTVLEDLLDYGQPLSNAQACSAYFSKLGCIENPWIAKKISEWDANSRGFLIRNLMHEAVFCSNIKPRATMAPQSCYVKPAEQEQHNEVAELDAAPELSDISTLSSGNSHSRQISREVSERQKARANRLSNDPVDPKALHEALEQVPVIVDSQTLRVDEWVREESVTPEWLCAKENSVPEPKPEHLPFDRALPLLPSAPLQTPQTKSRPLRTASSLTSLDPTVPARLPKTGSVDGNMPVTPPLRVRPRAPTYSSVAPSLSGNSDIHPALRPATPPAKALETKTPSSVGPATSHPPIPERNPRRPRARSLGPSSAFRDTTTVPCSGPAPTTRVSRTDSAVYAPTSGSSENSSDVTLPLQGTDDPFWNWDSARPTSPITPLASLTLMQNPVLNIPCTPTPTRREFKAQVDDEVRWSPPPWILASFSPHLVRHSRVEPSQEEQQEQEEEERPLPELRHKKSKTLPLLPSSDTPCEPRPPHSLRHSFHVPVSAFSSLHFSNPSTPQSSKKRKSHLNHESTHASSCVTAETPTGSSSPGSGGMWRIPHRVHISSQLQTKGHSSQTPVQVQARRRDSVSKKTSNKKERVWSLGAHIGKFGVDGGKGLMKRRSGTLGKEVGVSS